MTLSGLKLKTSQLYVPTGPPVNTTVTFLAVTQFGSEWEKSYYIFCKMMLCCRFKHCGRERSINLYLNTEGLLLAWYIENPTREADVLHIYCYSWHCTVSYGTIASLNELDSVVNIITDTTFWKLFQETGLDIGTEISCRILKRTVPICFACDPFGF